MTSSLSKKVLIEQAELDRLQQRQLHEHSTELQARVRLLNNMREITANKKRTAEERLNLISGMQIQFDKVKKEIWLLSGAIPHQVAREAPPTAWPMQPKVIADKGIEPKIEQEEKEQEEQYDTVLEEKDKSDQASALPPQMARVIWWNVPGINQQTAHRLLKKITEHPDIFILNENGEAVVYGDTIPGSNFKSLFKSMLSNQQNFNQVGIDEFLHAIRSRGFKKDKISGEPLKIMYSNVAPCCTHQRHSTPTNYKDEEDDDNEKEVRSPSHTHRVHKDKKASS